MMKYIFWKRETWFMHWKLYLSKIQILYHKIRVLLKNQFNGISTALSNTKSFEIDFRHFMNPYREYMLTSSLTKLHRDSLMGVGISRKYMKELKVKTHHRFYGNALTPWGNIFVTWWDLMLKYHVNIKSHQVTKSFLMGAGISRK